VIEEENIRVTLISLPDFRQAGIAVAVDLKSCSVTPINFGVSISST
jgi:hypothetical protein